ncbi:hypothetical protein SDC9_175490 [bioreactor metagenome]|uniref:Uncharacterized protein n=1 Tax=bioreactor metagenome TaxID=1076179 RepID=A0A645GM80_9ZZZZ
MRQLMGDGGRGGQLGRPIFDQNAVSIPVFYCDAHRTRHKTGFFLKRIAQFPRDFLR